LRLIDATTSLVAKKQTFDSFLNADALGIPTTIMLGAPFILTNKTGWTTEILELCGPIQLKVGKQ